MRGTGEGGERGKCSSYLSVEGAGGARVPFLNAIESLSDTAMV